MKYEMLKVSTVKRVWHAFYSHSMCNNDKYISYRGKDNYWYTDRERFVGRFFKRYEGRFIAFIDQEDIGTRDGAFFSFHEPKSVYSNKYRGQALYNGHCEPIIRARKRYLRIKGFSTVNELYGGGYIDMSCEDATGADFHIRLDHNNMLRIQFKQIPITEYRAVKALFQDDREPMPFNVHRFVEVKSQRGRKMETRIVEETTTVLARDAAEARESMTNVLDVSHVEGGNARR